MTAFVLRQELVHSERVREGIRIGVAQLGIVAGQGVQDATTAVPAGSASGRRGDARPEEQDHGQQSEPDAHHGEPVAAFGFSGHAAPTGRQVRTCAHRSGAASLGEPQGARRVRWLNGSKAARGLTAGRPRERPLRPLPAPLSGRRRWLDLHW